MLNRVVLVGRISKDFEVKQSQNGIAVCNFNIAVNRSFTDTNGERTADFFNCVVFRKQAENLGKYTRKGSLIGIDGRLQSRSYENKEGQRVYVTEVVCDSIQFLDPKKDNQQQQGSQQQGYGQQYQQQTYNQQPQAQYGQQPSTVDITDQDLPF